MMLALALIALTPIRPAEIWPDDRGRHIQAHGGGILKQGDTWYWFGEDRAGDNPPGRRYVSCYASKDLANWKFRRQVLKADDPEGLGNPFVLERPKVYPNRKTGKFVMYVHLDDARYAAAKVGVYVSDRIDGDYRFVKSFRPLGQESRDIGQFIDDDGTAYLIFESRPTKGFYIAKLSDDYLSVAEETCFVKAPLEGGGLIRYNGLYYLIGSYMTGWDPNPNVYATSPSLKGPWTEFKNLAPPEKKTYGAQSTMMVKVVGKQKTTVIFMGDMWRPKQHWDGRYLWMPLEIGDGKLWLPEPRPWTLDVKSGEVAFPTLEPPKPALEGFTADPAIRRFDDRYYLYPTSDKPNWQTTDFSVWSSKDLKGWKNEGMAMDVTKDLKWANIEAWAPDCIERNGKYYFYFCAQGQVGVAVGDKPTGPFRDALGRPLVAKGQAKTYPIDPYPFIDSDGQAYLFLGNGTPTVYRLKPDMVTLDGDPTYIPIKDFREGLCVFKRKDLYYFMWSEDDARSDDYRVSYGTATSPLGPVTIPADHVVLRKSGLVKGTGHHSVVNTPGTDRWVMAYHRHAIPNGSGFQRETCLAEMRFDKTGAILPIDPMRPFRP